MYWIASLISIEVNFGKFAVFSRFYRSESVSICIKFNLFCFEWVKRAHLKISNSNLIVRKLPILVWFKCFYGTWSLYWVRFNSLIHFRTHSFSIAIRETRFKSTTMATRNQSQHNGQQPFQGKTHSRILQFRKRFKCFWSMQFGMFTSIS